MSEEYLAIETELMREAVKCIVPYLPYSQTNKENSIKDCDYSREFVEALVKEIWASEPFCDHSVGICACGELGIVHELELRLKGQKTCPNCGGDGFVDEDYAECDKCNGKGVVKYDTTAQDH